MNFGIVGYGYTGQQHARGLRSISGTHLTAIAENDASRTAGVNAKTYLDYRDLLCDSSIQAVTICLPHFLHEQVALDALNAGKHVLVEKPLAISVEAGERLFKLAERVSRVLMVEMTHRFMPPVVEARQIVQAGRLGKILAVTETLFEKVGLFGSLPSWMFSKEKAGGGVGLTSGIHLLDHVTWIAGRPLSLQAARFGHSQGLGDIEDTAAFFLTSDNEIPVQLTLGWRSEGKSLEGSLCCHGTQGTLHVDCWGGWKIETDNGCQQRSCFDEGTSIAERALVGMTSALKEFVAAIRERRCPNPSPDESLVSQRLIEQAYLLAKSQ
jgi:phthalate 4,5-cis-dihydrodiol dehydrogenase